jgi:hypothetical protein
VEERAGKEEGDTEEMSHHSKSRMSRIARCTCCGNPLMNNPDGQIAKRCEPCSRMFRLALFGRFEIEEK